MGYSLKKYLIAGAVFLGTIVLLSACEPRKERVEKVHDRTGHPIIVTVHIYDTQRELDQAYRDLHGISRRDDHDRRYGFAVWPEWRDRDGNPVNEGGEWTCEIHILEPRFVDDDRTLTLGHEMVHCIYGSYHE